LATSLKAGQGLREDREVDRSPSGERIPASRGVESVLAANNVSRLSSAATIVPNSDISEGTADSRHGSVNGDVEESQGRLPGGKAQSVDEGNGSAERRAAGRGPGDNVALPRNDVRIIVTHERNVRISTTLEVVQVLGGNAWTVGQVVLNDVLLVRRHVEPNRESSSSGDQTSGIRLARNFGLAHFGTHGGTNGSNVRRRGREARSESASSFVVASVKVGNTIVTGGNHHSKSSETKLANFSVETVNIIGLHFVGKSSVGDRVNQGGLLALINALIQIKNTSPSLGMLQ